MGAAVGWAQANPSAVVRVNQVDDLLGAAVGGIANLLGQPERRQKVEVEGQRRVDVRNGEVDVVDASGCHLMPLSTAMICSPRADIHEEFRFGRAAGAIS